MSLVQQSQSFRDRQVAALEKMLHLNISAEGADLTASLNGEEIIWKVLVLDKKSTAVVSSVLRVNDLLRCGITMHTLIHSGRAAMPDVPAIYFVEPTKENVDVITQDLKSGKYSSFYVNFTSTLNRELLEDFAKAVAITGKSSKVLQVYDQYLDYVVTEPSLFSLEIAHVYSRFNDAKTSEEEINQVAETIANGLFDAIITMGNVPIIRTQNGGPAQLVAEKLDQRLRDYVVTTKASSTTDYSQRFVLILLDRNIDLTAMFSHTWIYQCLVSDVFRLERNTIIIEKEEDGKKISKHYDLDPKDFFWAKNAHLPFPDAVDSADAELKDYKNRAAELTKSSTSQNLNDLDGKKDDTLQQAVNQLPELTARKAVIDTHMDILLSLLKVLEAKKLDTFFEFEQSLNDPKTRESFIQSVNDGLAINLEDKLRTFIVMLLSTDLPADYVTRVETAFSKYENFDGSVLAHIKKVKENLRMRDQMVMNSYGKNNNASNTNNTGALFGSLSSKLYNLAEGRLGEGVSATIASGIKRLMPENKNMPITKIVETIMDPNNANEESLKVTDDYLYYDPKVTRGSHSRQPKRQSYLESVVFVVGGGNYLEYQNLQEWASNSATKGNIKTVVYGSDQMYSPSRFMQESSLLGA